MTVASERVRMGFIGVGNRGTQLLERFLRVPDVDVVALCDVYEPYLNRDRGAVHPRFLASGIPVPPMREALPSDVSRYRDFRELLDRDDIDAVCVATPDHWHAIQTVQAFEAGKDVFVEKPLTVTVAEGRRMVSAAAEHGRIGAVCLNRRGSTLYRELAGLVRGGAIGQVVLGYACRLSNMYPTGIGQLRPEPPPEDLDWDMWLGPRSCRPYQFNIAPYMFRWWSDYSSQMGNWGVHYLDVMRWLMGETAPVAVWAHGAGAAVQDDRTIPETMLAGFEFASGAVLRFEVLEGCGGRGVPGGEIELSGTKGVLTASQNRYRMTPGRAGQFQSWDAPFEEAVRELNDGARHGDLGIREDTTLNLIRDFIECVKTRREPLCTLEDGHRSTCFAHLANIALEVECRLEWDAAQECFTNCEAANQRLTYAYRQPWAL